MPEPEFGDYAKAINLANSAIAELHRAIAGVDRFNPMYFRALAAILALLSIITLALAFREFPETTISQFIFFSGSCLGVVATVLTVSEARTYAKRWQRAQAGLARTLRDADALASFALVSIDKTKGVNVDAPEMKAKYLALTYAIRDARERLGLKD